VTPRTDWAPHLLIPALALLALPAMSLPTWITLTVAGVAMGMMLFLMAAGLTLVFGLMDVLNFAHGAFIAIGAYLAVTVFGLLPAFSASDDMALNLAALAAAAVAAAVAAGLVGLVFERVLVRPVYGSHLRQILITIGGLIVLSQLVVALWGPQALALPRPAALRGSFVVAGAAIETYRVVAVGVGIAVFIGMQLALHRTRIGVLVRAGVEDRDMVEALGYRIRRLFVLVFVAGAALAGVGGAMWATYQQMVTPTIGTEMTVLVFIVVIIAGLGSVPGCFTGAMLVGLVANYAGFLAPRLALGSTLLLMVAILLWRPSGLFPATGR
jgi:branched-chain amino acid transport system permease protein